VLQHTQTRYELGLEFGSARTQKAITERTQNIISPQKGKGGAVGAAAQAVLNSVATAAADMPTQEMMQAAIDEKKPRPRPNLEASTPAEVYPLETLLPSGALPAIEVKEWIDTIGANEDVMVSSLYVSKRLKSLVQNKKNRKLKALRYILLLLTFNGSLKGKGKGPKLIRPREELITQLGVSNSVIDGMLRKFASGRSVTDPFPLFRATVC
jgi:DNA-directed RNA polymerase I subunit RPA49